MSKSITLYLIDVWLIDWSLAAVCFLADFLPIGRYYTVLYSISALTFNATERHQI